MDAYRDPARAALLSQFFDRGDEGRNALPPSRRQSEFGRRTRERATEREGEMTVARETKIESEGRQILGVRQLCQRTREAKLRDVPLQRHAREAPENVGEIRGGRPNRVRNLRQPNRCRELRLEI